MSDNATSREQLIKEINAAATKDALEALAKQHFDTDLDKRSGLETLRMQVLEMAEAQEGDESAGENDANGGQDDGAPVTAGGDQQSAPGGPAPEHTPATVQLSKPPRINPATNGTDARGVTASDDGKPAMRMLTNTHNGRRLAWTAELARLPHMREE